MKKLFFILCPVLFLLFASSSVNRKSNGSDLPQSMGDMVVFHEHSNYGGKQIRFYGSVDIDIPKFSQATSNEDAHVDSGQEGFNWNDKVSSIMIGKNKCLTVWKDANYKGSKYTFQPSEGTDLHKYKLPSGWNDKISSAKIRPRANCSTE